MNAWESKTFFWGWGEPFNKIVKLLLDNKGLLFSKRAAKSFGGYAGAQLRRFQNALARDSMPDMEKVEAFVEYVNRRAIEGDY